MPRPAQSRTRRRFFRSSETSGSVAGFSTNPAKRGVFLCPSGAVNCFLRGPGFPRILSIRIYDGSGRVYFARWVRPISLFEVSRERRGPRESPAQQHFRAVFLRRRRRRDFTLQIRLYRGAPRAQVHRFAKSINHGQPEKETSS